jgi:outer membrane immunogenic protein
VRKAGLIAAMVALSTVMGASVTCAQNASGFDGFYVGAHGGYGKVDNDGGEDVEGGIGGLHGGYNYVTGAMLIGIEGDYSWSDVSYERSENILGTDVDYSGSLSYFASVRARLGWLYGSRTLFYATAGYSWSEIEVEISASGLGSANESLDLSGAVLGGGVEYKFSNAFSARLEGLHYWGGNEDELGDDEAETNIIRAGLSYYLK